MLQIYGKFADIHILILTSSKPPQNQTKGTVKQDKKSHHLCITTHRCKNVVFIKYNGLPLKKCIFCSKVHLLFTLRFLVDNYKNQGFWFCLCSTLPMADKLAHSLPINVIKIRKNIFFRFLLSSTLFLLFCLQRWTILK